MNKRHFFLKFISFALIGLFFLRVHSLSAQTSCEEWNSEFKDRFENFNKGKVGNKLIELDSLYDLASEQCEKVKIYYSLTYSRYSMNQGELEKGKKYAQQAFKYAERVKNISNQKLALNFLQTCENKLGNTEKSLDILDQAIALECHEGNEDCNVENVKLKINKGTRLYNLGRNIDALKLLYEADSLNLSCAYCEEMNRVGIYNTIGNIYSQSGEYNKSIDAFKIALQNLPTGRNAQYVLFSNMSTQFRKLKRPKKHLKTILK